MTHLSIGLLKPLKMQIQVIMLLPVFPNLPRYCSVHLIKIGSAPWHQSLVLRSLLASPECCPAEKRDNKLCTLGCVTPSGHFALNIFYSTSPQLFLTFPLPSSLLRADSDTGCFQCHLLLNWRINNWKCSSSEEKFPSALSCYVDFEAGLVVTNRLCEVWRDT